MGLRSDGSYMKSLFLFFSIHAILGNCLAAGSCPQADFNLNCTVDLQDLQTFTEQWLDPAGSCSGEGCADFDGQDGVNAIDFALLACDWFYAIPLEITEFMADNQGSVETLVSGQPVYPDWVELHNFGEQSLNVGSFYLTNNTEEPNKWQFPEDTIIEPNGYLVVFTSGIGSGDYVDDLGFLHATFTLDENGEYLAIVAPDGQTPLYDYFPIYPPQEPDISYGLYSGEERYFGYPTPGTQNNPNYPGETEDTKFSYDRGLYNSPFDVSITCATSGAEIYYTLDGSRPGEFEDGTTLLYEEPIHIDTTTCLRAIAVRRGWKTTNVDTQTYIFTADVLYQTRPTDYPVYWWYDGTQPMPGDYEMDPEIYTAPEYSELIDDALLSIPTVSLVTDMNYLFNPSTDSDIGGIYMNPRQRGDEWERPASIEFFDANGTEQFQIDCGIRIHGSGSRYPQYSPKHSFGLFFRDIYGPKKLQFPLFDSDATDEFDNLVLRAGFNDTWVNQVTSWRRDAQYMRDIWARNTHRAMGHFSVHGRFVHLYINGLYWGLYEITEKPNEDFMVSYFGGEPEDYDVLDTGNVVQGSRTAWNAMMSIANAGVADNNQYHAIQEYLDVTSLADYMVLNHYAGNMEWDSINWYAARKREPGAGYKFFSWDAEVTNADLVQNKINMDNDGCPTHLFQCLRENAEFCMLFADRVHKHLFNGGPMFVDTNNPQYDPCNPERNLPCKTWMEIADQIDLAVIAESARWGDYRRDVHTLGLPVYLYTRNNHWLTEQNQTMTTYFPYRTQVMIDNFTNAGLYSPVTAPVFFADGEYQHGGYIETDEPISLSAPLGTIYYTLDGSDVRNEAVSISKIVLMAEDCNKKVLVPTGSLPEDWMGGNEPFDDTNWTDATINPYYNTGAVGFDKSYYYSYFLTYDVNDTMFNKNTSCYIRIPFVVDGQQIQNLNFMKLQVRYDDGFIAYLNGQKITERNAPQSPQWNSAAITYHYNPYARLYEDIDVSSHLGFLNDGQNILAIHGLNYNLYGNDQDFLISLELVAGQNDYGEISPSANLYTGPFTLPVTADVKARALRNDGRWSAASEAVFAVDSLQESLCITEIMYHPEDNNDPNEEFIELKNITDKAINLNLAEFTRGIHFTFPPIELQPDEYIVVVHDINTFTAYYGEGLPVAGEYDGQLDNGGERITLLNALGEILLDFNYDDEWYSATDGEGFSLTYRGTECSFETLSEKQSWRPSAFAGGSPGWDDTNALPELGSIVISEILAHSHDEPDWIELYNTTDQAINIGDWFLSDSDSDDVNRMKYQIPEGTVIDAFDFIVFYEDVHFGNPSDPCCLIPFALSENGETAYLRSASDGVLSGYCEQQDFGASETGVTIGRYYMSSTGTYDFVAMSQPTPDQENAYPKVGPVIITEFMYNPVSIPGDSYAEEEYEYIELFNTSDSAITLYDYNEGVPWKFTDAIDFIFPSNPVTINPSDYLLVVKNPAAFIERYPTVPTSKVFGPYDGQLSNGGEILELGKPGDIDQQTGQRHYICVERIAYSDGSHPEECPGGVDLWPTSADGTGDSLSRISITLYSNDPNNWTAVTPNPGI